MAQTFVSAEQVINLWKNTHGVELSTFQHEKLMTAVTLIVDGAYNLGKRDAMLTLDSIKTPEPKPDNRTDQQRYDSVTVTGSGRQVDKEPD